MWNPWLASVLVLVYAVWPCSSGDVPHIESRCLRPGTSEYCYSLYGTDNKQRGATAISWQQATDRCVAEGKQLAIVDAPESQAVVLDLITPITSDLGQIWISARRLHRDTAWKYTSGRSFTGRVQSFYGNNCVKKYMDKHGLVEYREIRCTDDGNVYALCQSNTTQAECAGYYASGLCYTTSVDNMDWFTAMTYCRNISQGSGTLAYTGLEHGGLRNWLNGTRGAKYSLEVLVGIRRQPWMWISESGDIAIKSFNWAPHAGYYAGDRCVTLVTSIITRQRGTWKDAPCSELWFYYLCQNGSIPTTTTSTTSTSTTTTPTTTTVTITTTAIPSTSSTPQGIISTKPSQGSPTPSPPGTTITAPDRDKTTTDSDGHLGPKHIAAIVVGILVIIIIIGSIFAIHRWYGSPCRRKDVAKPKQETYLPSDAPDVAVKKGAKQNGVIYHNGMNANGDVKTDTAVTIHDTTPYNMTPHDVTPHDATPHDVTPYGSVRDRGNGIPPTRRVNGDVTRSSDSLDDDTLTMVKTLSGMDNPGFVGRGIPGVDADADDNIISIAL